MLSDKAIFILSLLSTVSLMGDPSLITGSKISSKTTYTQTGALQLDIAALPGRFGSIATEGAANIGDTLILNALPGSNIQPGQTVDLITAAGGISGIFSQVDFLNFPPGLSHDLIYLSNSVQLLMDLAPVSTIVTPITMGAAPYVSMTTINVTNFMLGNNLLHLSSRIINLKGYERGYEEGYDIGFDEGYKEGYEEGYEVGEKEYKAKGHTTAANFIEGTLVADANPLSIVQVQSQERELTEKVAMTKHHAVFPSRFYIGPLDSLGTIRSRGVDQIGSNYNGIGFLTGYDHAFRNWGLGFATEYTYNAATNTHHAGRFNLHHLHESLYATWVPSSLKYLAVEGIVGGSFDAYHVYRRTGTTETPLTAKGKAVGTEADLLLGVEYIFSHRQFHSLPKKLRMIPLFNVQYLWMDVGGFVEKGADTYAIQVDSQQFQSFRSALGLRCDYSVRRENITYVPQLVVAWQREFLDRSRFLHFKTINMPVVQSASKKIVGAGRDTLLVEVDFLLTLKKVYEMEFRYDFQWNSMYRNNTFYLGIGGNF